MDDDNSSSSTRRRPYYNPNLFVVQKTNDTDYTYEIPIDNGSGYAQSTYEVPIGESSSIRSTTTTNSPIATPAKLRAELLFANKKISAQPLPGLARPILTVAPRNTNRVADSAAAAANDQPPLPLPPTTTTDEGADYYYDHVTRLDKPAVNVWWRGRLRLNLNLYLVLVIMTAVTLLAIGSTCAMIFLLWRSDEPPPACPTIAPIITTADHPEPELVTLTPPHVTRHHRSAHTSWPSDRSII